MTLQKTTNGSGWKLRLAGGIYLGVGSGFGLFTMGLIWAVSDMDDYSYVPDACEYLQCTHGTKTASDGRIHCAKYPPKDIKLSEVSTGYVTFCQSVVAFGGVSGLVCAALTSVFGAQWLLTRTQSSPISKWRIRLQQVAPFGAVLLPVSAVPFLWPYGIVPM